MIKDDGKVHCSWVSQVALIVKKHTPPLPMPETEETSVRSLGGEDPLEEGMATDSNILAQRIPWTEKPVGYSPQGCKESDTTEAT